jgi:hypothetical protein
MSGLFVRIFVETPSELIARQVGQRVAHVLIDSPEKAQVVTVRPYWKIKEYYEVCLRTPWKGDPLTGFREALARLGRGWEFPAQSDEAIWHPGTDAEFVEPLVRWAHIERV